MPAVMEAIDRMSFADNVKTMEYLWTAVSVAGGDLSDKWCAAWRRNK